MFTLLLSSSVQLDDSGKVLPHKLKPHQEADLEPEDVHWYWIYSQPLGVHVISEYGRFPFPFKRHYRPQGRRAVHPQELYGYPPGDGRVRKGGVQEARAGSLSALEAHQIKVYGVTTTCCLIM